MHKMVGGMVGHRAAKESAPDPCHREQASRTLCGDVASAATILSSAM